MPSYWLDSNVFITAKNGPYGFDVAPGFWQMIDQKTMEGQLCSSTLVYDELVGYQDELSVWVKDRKDEPMFSAPDADTQTAFGKIADYVKASYEKQHADKFLAGADPWVIAHAMVRGATVVTCESLAAANCRKVKIPNVCTKFGVQYIGMYGMIRKMGLVLIQ